MTPRVLTLVVLFLILASGTAVVGLEPPLRIEDIRAAWTEREAKARSLRIEWKQTDFVVKGADSMEVNAMKRKGREVPISPPEDYSFTSSPVLTLDGDKCAFRFLRRQWNSNKQLYGDIPTEHKFVGGKQLDLNHAGLVAWPVAKIHKVKRAEIPDSAWPVLRTFRPIDDKLRMIDLDDYVVTGIAIQINARKHYELVLKGSPTRTEQRFWVDPHQGHTITRSTMGPPDRPSHQIDTKYRSDPTLGWVPTGWTMSETSPIDGRVVYTITATVSKCEVGEVDSNAFDFALPAGTRVVNLTGDGPRDYITKEGGNNRVVGPSDIGKTYDEMLNSSGQESNPLTWLQSPIGITVFVLGGLFLFYLRIRVLRRKRSTSPPSGPPG